MSTAPRLLSNDFVRVKQERRKSSVEMKLVILLVGLPFALGYKERYQGFDNCGVDGWLCSYVNGKYEVTYQCSENQPSARVWVWTARLPNGASIFTVRDCEHLEVHMDCTKNIRTTILSQFKVINVTFLDFLQPIPPGVFLHDNDQIPQAPPFLYIENVRSVKWYPGLFDKPGGACRYKYIELTSLTLVNVRLGRIIKDMFRNQHLHQIVMNDTVIDAVDGFALSMDADAFISGTTFPFLPSNAITIKGDNISFVNNVFQKIQTSGLTIRSKDFHFVNNQVEEIGSQGLDVLASRVLLANNNFTHLNTEALQKITPGYLPKSYEVAFKFVYNFSGNYISNINPGSLHLNWEIYKKVCSEIIFEKNIFECSCTNLGWISLSNGLGPKISKVTEFYDMYLGKEGNVCHEQNSCPLSAVVARIQDVCNNKTNVSTICTEYRDLAEFTTTTRQYDHTLTKLDSTQQPTDNGSEKVTKFIEPVLVTEKIVPVLSYSENQTSQPETRTLPIWIIIVPTLVALAAVCLGIFIWWYKKKKQRQVITTMYKNEKGPEGDSLVVINECLNELYDKQ